MYDSFHWGWLLAFEWGSSRRKIIVKESVFGESVKIQGQEQGQEQRESQ